MLYNKIEEFVRTGNTLLKQEIINETKRILRKYNYVDMYGLFPNNYPIIADMLVRSPYKNLLLVGEPGVGKSLTARVLADLLADEYIIVPPTRMMLDFSSLIYQIGIENDRTVLKETWIAHAIREIENGKRVALIFEEIDQFREGLLKQGDPFFDNPREFHIVYGEARRIKVPADKLLVIATMNLAPGHLSGDKSEALVSRFITIRMEPDRRKLVEMVSRATGVDKLAVNRIMDMVERINKVVSQMQLSRSRLTVRDALLVASIYGSGAGIITEDIIARILASRLAYIDGSDYNMILKMVRAELHIPSNHEVEPPPYILIPVTHLDNVSIPRAVTPRKIMEYRYKYLYLVIAEYGNTTTYVLVTRNKIIASCGCPKFKSGAVCRHIVGALKSISNPGYVLALLPMFDKNNIAGTLSTTPVYAGRLYKYTGRVEVGAKMVHGKTITLGDLTITYNNTEALTSDGLLYKRVEGETAG